MAAKKTATDPAGKTLYLLRHGKSSWDDPALKDAQRPLRKRGLRDAERMAHHVATLPAPELILCSDARRTKDTLKPFLGAWNLSRKEVCFTKDLYLAPADALLSQLHALGSNNCTVMLVGHNPGFTDLINLLVPKASYLSNLPTTGFVVLKVPSWEGLKKGNARLDAFWRPRDLKD